MVPNPRSIREAPRRQGRLPVRAHWGHRFRRSGGRIARRGNCFTGHNGPSTCILDAALQFAKADIAYGKAWPLEFSLLASAIKAGPPKLSQARLSPLHCVLPCNSIAREGADGASLSHMEQKLSNSAFLVHSFGDAFMKYENHWKSTRPLNRNTYITMLAAAYVTSGATSKFFPVAVQRCRSGGYDSEAEFIAEKLHEETGHDRLAVADLYELGYDAVRLVDSLPLERHQRLTKKLRSLCQSEHPVSCLGYAFTLEHFASFRDSEFLKKIDDLTPIQAKANRTFSVHSGEGADADHIDELICFIDDMQQELFVEVLAAAMQTAEILAEPNDIDTISDTRLESLIKAAKL